MTQMIWSFLLRRILISIEEFKKALGPTCKSLTDDEIKLMRDIQDRFADIVFDRWLKKVNGNRSVLKATKNGKI